MYEAELIDITSCERSMIDALAEEQPSVDCEGCGGEGCSNCYGLGYLFVFILT